MAVTPMTNIKLLKCPLELDNKNQITFASKQAQFNYFNSLPYLEIDDCSYQRKDNYISYPAHIDTLLEYNYVMYQNENYTNKWFYAFITNMVYENDGTTFIYISTDVFQTWQFDLTWKQSFVEREMCNVADDVPGFNLVPEGLETGEYKIGGTASFDELTPVCILAYTRDPHADGFTQEQPIALGVIANGVPNGMYLCFVSIGMVQGLLDTINSAGHGDAIMTVFTVPAFALVGFNGWTIEDLQTDVLWWLVTDFKANPVTKTLASTPSSLDGYTPRNQKLRTYPYLYLGFCPPNGSNKVYRYEDFTNGTPVFKLYSEINQNPTLAFVPQNYRGITGDSLPDASYMNGYPTIGWITEYYNTWLLQNTGIIDVNMRQEDYNYRHNQGIQQAQNVNNAISSLVGAIGSGLSGNIGGGLSQATGGGANLGIAIEKMKMETQNHYEYENMQMKIKEQQQLLPNQGKLTGSNATLLGYGLMDNNIFNRFSIKAQFARRIDKYFDTYGYQTNETKIPNLNNRPNWNFVKTVGANILGNIPQEDLELLKAIFDTGVTLWHNTSTFLDYSQNNR